MLNINMLDMIKPSMEAMLNLSSHMIHTGLDEKIRTDPWLAPSQSAPKLLRCDLRRCRWTASQSCWDQSGPRWQAHEGRRLLELPTGGAQKHTVIQVAPRLSAVESCGKDEVSEGSSRQFQLFH